MDRIRIGCVKYLNTVPLIEGLASWQDAELVMAVPSHLIDMLLEHRIDVGLVSLIDAARAGGRVALLPVGMIGSDGPTLTVRLHSRVPFEDVQRVHVDTDSHTSVALAQIVFDRRFGIRPEVVLYDARRHVSLDRGGSEADAGWPDTVLLIGDKVVTDPPPEGEYPHQLDLGEAWRDLTGLPFTYAVWMCRADEVRSPAVRDAMRVLDRARRHNRMRMDWLVGARSGERGWPAEEAGKYLGESLKYDIGDRERMAVEQFFNECARLGLAPSVTPIWASA